MMTDECLFCGATENLEEHHTVPRRKAQLSDDLAVMEAADRLTITVCHDCHMKLEDVYDERFYSLLMNSYLKRWKKRAEKGDCPVCYYGEVSPLKKRLADKAAEIDEEEGL